MRGLRILLTVALASALPVAAQIAPTTLDRPLEDPAPSPVDSGFLTNGSRSPQVVITETVQIEGADWMRLYFGNVGLDGGSFLRITSPHDGEVQELDAETLAMWSNTSAYFNGDAVVVELVAGPGTTGNRLVIERVASEAAVATGGGCSPGCCGADDRVLSDEDWSSRLLPAGCSASIYNPDSCAVSAGHCIGGSMVLEFKVPLSNANCSLNHPPIEDQFPVIDFQFTNGGPGNDWAAMVVGDNNLGQTPFERYGEFRPIQTSPPQVGQPVSVWGYGVDDDCTVSQVQQTSDGFIETLGSTLIRYSVDVTFGNSGSGVLRDGEEIVGIVTHCCCPNQGTRVDHPAFEAARENLCTTAPLESAPLVSADVVVGVPVSGALTQLEGSDDDHFVVDSETSGSRNTAFTEVVAQSPHAVVSELNLTVEYGPADANPVFYAVLLFDHDSGSWVLQDFGVASESGDTVVELTAVLNPNDYVNGAGEILVGVAQTAREPQTPGGFEKLIDQVAVTVRP